MPAGKNFSIDNLSFKVCTPNDGVPLMDNDVGNIIYNNDAGAYKRFVLTDQGSSPDYYHTGLHNQGDFYYNPGNWTVEVYSTSNPASYYSDVEVARGANIVVGGSYVTISNLALQYGSQHGFYFANQHDFTVSNCDVSWIGGDEQGSVDGNGNPVRYGDAFETLFNLSNVVIEDCKVWEIYDGAMGNQGFASESQSNITFQNNIIWDCHGGFGMTVEDTCTADGIYFYNNTIAYSGFGWSEAVRPDTGRARPWIFGRAVAPSPTATSITTSSTKARMALWSSDQTSRISAMLYSITICTTATAGL